MKISQGVTFQICFPKKLRLLSTKIMNICNQTRILVLNVNLLDLKFHMTQANENFENSKMRPPS